MLAEAKSGEVHPKEDNPGKSRRDDREADKPTVIETLGDQVRSRLIENVGSELIDSDLDQDELRKRVSEELEQLIESERLPLTSKERTQMVLAVTGDLMGLGPLEPLLEDIDVSEVMVNGTDAIYVERHGRIVLTDVRFRTEKHLRQVIDRIVASVGRRVDETSPMVDARLSDGSRVNAIIPPLAVDGSTLTIRKFSATGLDADDLVSRGALSRAAVDVLQGMVEGSLNILVAGGTGTGKTTFLNMLSGFIPSHERIVTIEDAVELRLRQRHVIRLECRPANIEGKGEVGIRDLVRNSLRMRPDRVIIGECRGAEALDMLQAMNTGHDGSLTTLHANSPRDALARIETMVMFAGFDLPTRAIREQMASAIDIVVHLERLPDGRRAVASITEVIGMESDQITLNELFALHYDSTAPNRADGSPSGPTLRSTGIRPYCSDTLANRGVVFDASLFEASPW